MKRNIIIPALITILLTTAFGNFRSLYFQDNLNVEISLWFEYHKNGDFETSLKHGWNIVKLDPKFTKYKFYSKMEEMLWNKYENENTDEAMKTEITDTTLYLYNLAIENDSSKSAYFTARKGYVLEVWKQAELDTVISTYFKALELDPSLDDFYKDRLGLLLIKSERKQEALDLYSKLADEDSENALWNQRMEGIAEDPYELMDILEKAWKMDEQNLEKAWKFASFALKLKEYEKSIVPLEFLVGQSGEVINYWKQLSTAYEKLEKTDEAINAYKKLIELQPDNKENFVNIAIIYKNLDQLSVARTYLYKAMNIDSEWDYPYLIEAQIYEQAARNCVNQTSYEFLDKCVYQLAVDTYRRAAAKNGSFSSQASSRVGALQNSVPSQEDYFFRKYKNGTIIKIEGKCYNWIGKSITVNM